MTYVELQIHVVFSNYFLLVLRLFKCIGCQNAYTHVKNIRIHQFTRIQKFLELSNG
jgi:hypothetical protein